MFTEHRLEKIGMSFLTFVLITTAARSVASSLLYTSPKAAPPVPCVGEPLNVNYPFQGGFIEDHACKAQCGTQAQRYILYTNGKTTQCQMLPGCNDEGEDQGRTCIPPGGSADASDVNVNSEL